MGQERSGSGWYCEDVGPQDGVDLSAGELARQQIRYYRSSGRSASLCRTVQATARLGVAVRMEPFGSPSRHSEATGTPLSNKLVETTL